MISLSLTHWTSDLRVAGPISLSISSKPRSNSSAMFGLNSIWGFKSLH